MGILPGTGREPYRVTNLKLVRNSSRFSMEAIQKHFMGYQSSKICFSHSKKPKLSMACRPMFLKLVIKKKNLEILSHLTVLRNQWSRARFSWVIPSLQPLKSNFACHCAVHFRSEVQMWVYEFPDLGFKTVVFAKVLNTEPGKLPCQCNLCFCCCCRWKQYTLIQRVEGFFFLLT